MDDDFNPSGKVLDSSVEPKITVEDKDSHKEPTYADVFKNKNFMKLLSGQFFSNFGDAVFRVAIQLYVYEITLSITSMTLILAVQTIPWIIIGPIAGVFADRISRKALMIGADIVRGLAILALPFMSSIYGIAVIAFILGAASATFVAPRSAAIPEITGMRLYVKAISLSQLVFQTLAVIGPLFAAPLYIIFKASTFWITSGCFFVSAVILGFVAIPSASRDKNELLTFKTVLTDFKEGI
ncbi:MAG: MFS transporter, partial [Candidatus Heimdallarchaeota archaeon]|nr:MFS transporter [Candidatus Heimdallarchaeota archaeon]